MANCLYNGVELPAKVEHNEETHPYEVIGYSDIQGYVFSYSANPWTADEDGRIWPNRFLTYRLSDDGTTWESTSGSVTYTAPIWANYDILNEDGSVYLAASDPIPVGGSEGGGGDTPDTPDSIEINCPDSIEPGEIFEISCTDSSGTAVKFYCVLSRNNSDNTRLTKITEYSYSLYCGSDETAASLRITVTGTPTIGAVTPTATKDIEVIYNNDPGGGGGDDSGGDEPGETTATPEQLKKAFWSGYAAARALFGLGAMAANIGGVGNSGGTGNQSAIAAQLKSAFWKGFAAGCAT